MKGRASFMATLSIENIERVNAEITANEKSGVVAYVFAVQFTPATVSFVKVPTTETRGLAKMLKISGKKIMLKATKEFKNVLDNLKVEKALVVLNDMDNNVIMSAKNIPTVKTASTNTINVYDILKYNTVVVTKDAVNTIQEVYA